MAAVLLFVKNILKPQILVSEKDFLVVYKPPKMHSAPLAHSPSDNLFDWCAGKCTEILNLSGRRAGEGGLLHRLDFETQGLVLIAKTQLGMEVLLEQQKNGRFIKEYCALASAIKIPLQGFPRQPKDANRIPFTVKSAFRAYGYGRKSVRPVIGDWFHEKNKGLSKDIVFDGDSPYVTEIFNMNNLPGGIRSLRLSLRRGFRHQIRCHLAWLGMPILNDSLYGGSIYGRKTLGLRAYSLSFTDPSTGKVRAYSIPPLKPDDV